MSVRLRSLVWEGPDTCRGLFQVDGSTEQIETVFQLMRIPKIVGVTADPDDIFHRLDIDAIETKAIVAAVVKFCRVAQGDVSDEG